MSAAADDHQSPVDRVLDALRARGKKVTGGPIQYNAQCPAHDDRSPSLGVRAGDNGGALICCQAGCTWQMVAHALNLTASDLFPPKPTTLARRRKVRSFQYRAADGQVIVTVERWEGEGPKFTRTPAGVRNVPLYNLPEVLAAIRDGRWVIVCEGERDAETAGMLWADLGGVGTTNISGAAHQWTQDELDTLRGAKVVLIGDNDTAGRGRVDTLMIELTGVVKALHVRFPAAGRKDLTEHVQAKLGRDELRSIEEASGDVLPADVLELEGDDEEPETATGFPYVDWADAYAGTDGGERAIVEGFMFPGRWTQVAAAAKQGKSEWSLSVGHNLTRGLDPTGETNGQEPVTVIYLDSEMGRLDVVDRFRRADLEPHDLQRLHYCDVPAPLNTTEGANKLLADVDRLGATVVIIDGLNGFVEGEENSADTWIKLFNATIAELKKRGVAVLSNDNQGREQKAGGRGSSAKIDKADIVFELKRTDEGVQLKRTHARTDLAAAYIDLVIHGIDGTEAVRYTPVNGSWPQDTARVAALLDRLGVDERASNRAARLAIRGSGEKVSNEVLAAAIRWRKSVRNTLRNASYPQGAEHAPEHSTISGTQPTDQHIHSRNTVSERSEQSGGSDPERPGGYTPGTSGDWGANDPTSKPVDNYPDPMEDF